MKKYFILLAAALMMTAVSCEPTNENGGNKTQLTTPVVSAEVNGKSAVISWAKVADAKDYTITLGDKKETIAELTKTFADLAEGDYTVNVVANPADAAKFTASNAGVANFTIKGEAPTGDVRYEDYLGEFTISAKTLTLGLFDGETTEYSADDDFTIDVKVSEIEDIKFTQGGEEVSVRAYKVEGWSQVNMGSEEEPNYFAMIATYNFLDTDFDSGEEKFHLEFVNDITVEKTQITDSGSGTAYDVDIKPIAPMIKDGDKNNIGIVTGLFGALYIEKQADGTFKMAGTKGGLSGGGEFECIALDYYAPITTAGMDGYAFYLLNGTPLPAAPFTVEKKAAGAPAFTNAHQGISPAKITRAFNASKLVVESAK